MRHARSARRFARPLAGLACATWLLARDAPAAGAARSRRAPASAAAAPAAAATAAPARPGAAELQRLGEELLASDVQRVEDAAARLVAARGPEALERLHEALALGLAPQPAAIVIEAAGQFQDARSFRLLASCLANRNMKVRLAAVTALAGLRAPALEAELCELLRQRLGDPEPEVRAAAAEALAARGDAGAFPRLFKLLQRGDAGAAAALGRLAPLDEAPRIAELRGVAPDAPLATALGELLRRPEAPERLRLDLVRTLGGIPGPEATAALVEYLTAHSDGQAAPSVEEAQRLVDRRAGQ